ncbi:MAG TPA: spore maturation protein, partial [Firmicutes bacterium]|nr:spore maturation protein [Bacillota bacterium]
VLTVYFGAVGIKEYRHTLHAGLATDVAAFIGSILIARLFL